MNSFTNTAKVTLQASNEAQLYASHLLGSVGAETAAAGQKAAISSPSHWFGCGMGDLTGYPDSSPVDAPLPLASYADAALDALRALSSVPLPASLNGGGLLALRAQMTGLSRQGAISAGGSCRILPTADGHIAVNLARDYDWQLLDAWLLTAAEPNWENVAQLVNTRTTKALLDQGRLLGLAIADAETPVVEQTRWFDLCYQAPGKQLERRGKQLPRVIDLSSLWAGPLCSHLLQLAGAEVIKVESSQRPDGARNGSPAFFDFLNGQKQQLQLDLHNAKGQQQLGDLIRSADIVIEGSRPRALRQMNIHAEAMLDDNPGLSWISISGYGRNEPEANWIAYGDDAGVAAGLSALLKQSTGQWMFCGDAIADPFTGLHAAVAALASWREGGGKLISLSLVQTLRHAITFHRKLSSQQGNTP